MVSNRMGKFDATGVKVVFGKPSITKQTRRRNIGQSRRWTRRVLRPSVKVPI
jgi:hypothetical protein